MLFGLAAAASAIDLVKTLVQSGSSSTTTAENGFAAASTSSSAQSVTAGLSGGSRTGQTSFIAPDTMNALFAAQGQGDTAATSSRSAALKDLFKLLDGDGDGQISKSEFETALGAGGSNTAKADSVFDKLDTDGDGKVSLSEMSSALKGKHRGHAHGLKPPGGDSDPLMQALDGASASTTTNSDGSVTTSLTYADGSTVTTTQPATASAVGKATRSYNAIEQMIQRQASLLTQSASASVSLNA